MSARAKNRQPVMKRLLALLTTLVVLTGCAQAASVMPTPGVTLAPPTPAGLEELPPEQVRLPMPDNDDCDRRASLRPFPTRAEADAAVAYIRERGRLIVGLDIGSNLFSFRDPITGNITGFDVDIAGRSPATSSAAPPRSTTASCRRPTGSSRCRTTRSTSSSRR